MTQPRGTVREIAAAIVLLGRTVLVQTRPQGRSYEGWWEFPGGKLEPGEDAAACAVRECREELGLDVTVREPLHVQRWDDPVTPLRVTFLLCEPRDPAAARAAARPREGQQLRWAGPADLTRLRFLPANAEVLELLARRLAEAGPGPSPGP